jgi:hypothetical protein
MTFSELLSKIDPLLLSGAEVAAKAANRDISEQLILWIRLGQLSESMLTAAEIEALMNGRAELSVVKSSSKNVSLESNVDIVTLAMSHQNQKSFDQAAAYIKEKNKGPL